MTEEMHESGYRCGRIRYRARRHTGNAFVCNCRYCQRVTGGPFLIEHCFTRDEIEILRGTPKVWVHVSERSGAEVHMHFCADCGAHLFLAPRRCSDTFNIFTASLDDPTEVDYGPATLQYLFLDAAQTGTAVPAGFRSYSGHCEPADLSGVTANASSETQVQTAVDDATEPHTGGRLCGAVRFAADGSPEFIIICHCRSCQRLLGTAMNFQLTFDPASFRVLIGKPMTFRHEGGSGRAVETRFCGDCSSPLWLIGDRFPGEGVFRGALDRPNRIVPGPGDANQIFLDEAMPCSVVIARIEAFPRHRRTPDNTINTGREFDQPWRIVDVPR